LRPTQIRDFTMKSLDLISKRILVISLGISAVLLSASLLIFAARPANAQTPAFSSRMDDGRRYDAVSFNSGTAGYFLIWNTQTGTFKTVSSSVSIAAYPDGVLHNSTVTHW